VRDVILGSSDGLTEPFALAAGLRGAARLAGGIAMGLGGYLSEKSHAEIYPEELEREHREVDEVPDIERHEVCDIWQARGYNGAELDQRVDAIIAAATAGPRTCSCA